MSARTRLGECADAHCTRLAVQDTGAGPRCKRHADRLPPHRRRLPRPAGKIGARGDQRDPRDSGDAAAADPR
jgi:hypothetical protein